MPQSHYPARAVRAKTREVVDYHRDEAQPGKPLQWLIPGGLIAVASLLAALFVIYRTWIDPTLSEQQGITLLLIMAPVYVVGVFMFSYGYELYDVPKAIRLTALIVVLTFAIVIIVAVLLVVLGSGKSSSSRKSSSSSDSGSTELSDSSSGGSGGIGGILGPIFIGGPTQTVTREVTREIVREAPMEPPPPEPITCAFCNSLYVPEDNQYACPNCGAATSEESLPPERRQKPDSES
jgi:uncharacterized membrane protein YhaH (DUF805 family)